MCVTGSIIYGGSRRFTGETPLDLRAHFYTCLATCSALCETETQAKEAWAFLRHECSGQGFPLRRFAAIPNNELEKEKLK